MSKLAEAQISLTIANENERQIEELSVQLAQKVDSAELNNYMTWSDADGLTIKDADSSASVNISASGVSIYAEQSADAQAIVSAQEMHIPRADITMLQIGGYILQSMSDGSIVLKEV